MNIAATQHLVEQLRTGLIQPEELTEPEVLEVLALKQEQPAVVPIEVERSLRRRLSFISPPQAAGA